MTLVSNTTRVIGLLTQLGELISKNLCRELVGVRVLIQRENGERAWPVSEYNVQFPGAIRTT